MTLLSVEDLVVTYKQPGQAHIRAVDGVSFSVSPGEVLSLVGESGCGKSTIARTVCGLEKIHSGNIFFEQTPVHRIGLRARAQHELRIQMVFQNPYSSLNPRRIIRSQIEDALTIHPDKNAWTVESLLTAVELDHSAAQKYPHAFSGGQRQRIAIARALASGPKLLIADEPIASLDASLQSSIATLMCKLVVESGAGMLFISHDLAIVREISDRVIVMNSGKIVEQNTAERIWNAPTQEYTQNLLKAIPRIDGLGQLPG